MVPFLLKAKSFQIILCTERHNLFFPVVALIMGKNGEKMDFGYGKTFLEKVSWGGPETPFCGISGPIPACGGVYTEKWTKF